MIASTEYIAGEPDPERLFISSQDVPPTHSLSSIGLGPCQVTDRQFSARLTWAPNFGVILCPPLISMAIQTDQADTETLQATLVMS